MIKDNKILKASRSKYKQIYIRKQKLECNYTLSTTHSQESIEESVLTKVESQKKKRETWVQRIRILCLIQEKDEGNT